MVTLAEIKAQASAVELEASLEAPVAALKSLLNTLDRSTGHKNAFLANAPAQMQADLLPAIMAVAKGLWDGPGGRAVFVQVVDRVAGMMINPATSAAYTRDELLDACKVAND